MRLNALFRLAFATAPRLRRLTSPHTVTRRLIMQKARRQLTGAETPGRLRPLVSRWFQVLFHSPPGVLFTFPSRYWSAIGRRRVFSLRRWSSQIHTRFLVSRATWVPVRGERVSFRLQGYHLLWPDVPDRSARNPSEPPLGLQSSEDRSHNPINRSQWFRLVPFRSPLLGESLLLSLPRVTKMFQFARFARITLYIQVTVFRVAPFGNLRINACFQLPGVYRR